MNGRDKDENHSRDDPLTRRFRKVQWRWKNGEKKKKSTVKKIGKNWLE
jgi:hypothetical protein